MGAEIGEPHAVEGIPGLWSGYDVDAVTGEGTGGGQPALPDEVVGCLDGT